MNTQGILFDLDGTLIDSAADLANAYNAVRKLASLKPYPVSQLKPKVAYGTIELMCQDFAVTPEDERFKHLRQQFTDIYINNMTCDTHLFDGIADLLHSLAQQSIPWAIVTNKPARFALPIIEHFECLQAARCVICRDTIECFKPHPRPLQYACQQMAIRPADAIMVGDTETDVLSARNAGMPAVIVNYAYQTDAEIERWRADIVIDHPLDLLPWMHTQQSKETNHA